jgi:hypothetical protein
LRNQARLPLIHFLKNQAQVKGPSCGNGIYLFLDMSLKIGTKYQFLETSPAGVV